jgi:hypothetical protein
MKIKTREESFEIHPREEAGTNIRSTPELINIMAKMGREQSVTKTDPNRQWMDLGECQAAQYGRIWYRHASIAAFEPWP